MMQSEIFQRAQEIQDEFVTTLEIADVVGSKKDVDVVRISEKFGVSIRTALNHLHTLYKNGGIKRKREGRIYIYYMDRIAKKAEWTDSFNCHRVLIGKHITANVDWESSKDEQSYGSYCVGVNGFTLKKREQNLPQAKKQALRFAKYIAETMLKDLKELGV